MDYVLTTEALSKHYGHFKALDGLNMHVPRGSVYGLVGRNGAGKTTFIRLLCGLQSPTSGSYSLYGVPNTDRGLSKIRRRMGAVVETPSIYLDLTAEDNLKEQYLILGRPSFDGIAELLKLVGLEDTGRKKARNFSLGMKQRLGIALALVGDPDLVILDEPINGLDPQGIAEVRNTIELLNREKGITFIISSHILGELAKFATNYGIIHGGQLLEELSMEELLEKCTHRIILNTAAAPQACTALEKLGITRYKVTDKATVEIYERLDEIPAVTAALCAAGIPVNGIQLKQQELEDYFLGLTGGTQNA